MAIYLADDDDESDECDRDSGGCALSPRNLKQFVSPSLALRCTSQTIHHALMAVLRVKKSPVAISLPLAEPGDVWGPLKGSTRRRRLGLHATSYCTRVLTTACC